MSGVAKVFSKTATALKVANDFKDAIATPDAGTVLNSDTVEAVPDADIGKGDENTSSCISKYEKAISDLIKEDNSLEKIKTKLFSDNVILNKYISEIDKTKITKFDDGIISDNISLLKIMEEDIKYLLRGNNEAVLKEYETNYELLYINSIHLLNAIHLINYYNNIKDKDEDKEKDTLNLYKAQYKYYYLRCVELRKKDNKVYNFIRKDKDTFIYEINQELTNIAYPQTRGGGKKSLSLNAIKEIADKLKVSHSKCKSKESIMSKIKSIDLQKLTIEQLKIYCKLFNIRGCSKCKSKKSLLLHTKSNMKVR
jgi:vacuolar-type H+-ATPase subunit I/STV1